MDAQTHVRATSALVALTQALARLEAGEDYAPARLLAAAEVLDENRFLAARDGLAARFVIPGSRRSVPARVLLADAVAACRPHAAQLGTEGELALVEELADDPPANRQRRAAARRGHPSGAVAAAAAEFGRPTASTARTVLAAS
jgi:carboxylate-amine ligase